MTRIDDLSRLRDKLLAALDVVEPAEVPRISKELRAVVVELETLAPSADPDSERLDELRKRRAARQAAS